MNKIWIILIIAIIVVAGPLVYYLTRFVIPNIPTPLGEVDGYNVSSPDGKHSAHVGLVLVNGSLTNKYYEVMVSRDARNPPSSILLRKQLAPSELGGFVPISIHNIHWSPKGDKVTITLGTNDWEVETKVIFSNKPPHPSSQGLQGDR